MSGRQYGRERDYAYSPRNGEQWQAGTSGGAGNSRLWLGPRRLRTLPVPAWRRSMIVI